MNYENRNRTFECFLSENFNFMLHIHSEIELIYIRSGEMEVTVGNDSQLLKSGDMAIIFPHIAHSYKTERESTSQIIIFNPDIVDDYEKTMSLRRPTTSFVTSENINEDVIYVLKQLQRDGRWQESRRLLKGYLLVIMSHLLTQTQLEEAVFENGSDITAKVLNYIDKSFSLPINLESVAKNIGVSKYYLSRVFSDKIGTSFNNYLNTVRVNCAKGLLEISQKSVTEIGYECGFESQSTFYRAFKQNENVTPLGYRKELK